MLAAMRRRAKRKTKFENHMEKLGFCTFLHCFCASQYTFSPHPASGPYSLIKFYYAAQRWVQPDQFFDLESQSRYTFYRNCFLPLFLYPAANSMLAAANAAFLAEEYAEALRMWTEVLDAVDTRSQYALHTNRGAALERLGRPQEAIEAYNAALATNPRHLEALHNRGVAYRGLGRHEEALSSFVEALGIDASFLPSLRAKTETLVSLNRLEEAIAAASESVKQAPQDAGPVADRAFALLKNKRCVGRRLNGKK